MNNNYLPVEINADLTKFKSIKQLEDNTGFGLVSATFQYYPDINVANDLCVVFSKPVLSLGKDYIHKLIIEDRRHDAPEKEFLINSNLVNIIDNTITMYTTSIGLFYSDYKYIEKLIKEIKTTYPNPDNYITDRWIL